MIDPKPVVIISLAATAGVVTAGRFADGKAPEPRVYLALGFTFLVVSAVADVEPNFAAPLAGLVFVAVGIAYAPKVAKALQKVLKSGPAPGEPGSGVSAPGTGGNPATGGGALNPVVTPSAGIMDPLAGLGKVIANAADHRSRARGDWQSDNALDIAIPVGSPVYAVDDGTISNVGYQGSTGVTAGWKLTLNTAGNSYWYGHLVTQPNVRDGQRVKKGQIIGRTGIANGVAHLHIGVRVGDPERIFRKKGT